MTVILRWVVAAALVIFSMTVVSSLLAGTVHGGRARLMLTLSVIVAGGSLLVADLTAPREKREKIAGWIGAATTIVAAVLSLLLTWNREGDLFKFTNLWRAWWVLSGVSLTIAHVLLLRLARGDTPWRLWTRRITIGGTLVFATLTVLLTFRRDILSTPPDAILWPILVALSVEVVGSLVLWFWARPDPKPVTVPWRAFRWGWYITSPVFLLAIGFYLGRVTMPGEGLFVRGAGALAALKPEAIDEQVEIDLDRLRSILECVEKSRQHAQALKKSVIAPMKTAKRTVFTPDEDDAVRSLFFTYLSYRTALLRMVAYYQGFEGLPDPKRRQRCFLVGFGAGVAVYDASLTLVGLCHEEPFVREKLNESEEAWGIPAGMFDRVHESVAMERNVDFFEEMSAYYDERRSEWRLCGLEKDDLEWLEPALDRGIESVQKSPLYGKRPPLRLILERVRKDAYTPVYAVQSLLSIWIGDTRLVTKAPCISRAQVDELRGKMQPGDIILERRNWFLSNAFLPGFWPHAELYVGTPEEIERLGLKEEPAVRDRWEKFVKLAPDGEPHCLIESISEGVAFSSLSEGCRADYIVVLRPKVGLEEKKKAILRAFSHQGKPYDFEFDFFSADKLVCTELVYRAYEGIVHFELKKIMGRMTLPAVEMARKFSTERTTKPELEFVAFLDTPRGADHAVWAGEKEFCESTERPRAFSE